MKIGIDLHGVITKSPHLFSEITHLFVSNGHEVHIITGSRKTDELLERLKAWEIVWTHIFSIADYHHSIGTPMTGYDEGNPTIDNETWNKTKAWYALTHQIDLHIDDSDVYGKYFHTPYLQYSDDSSLFSLFWK